MTKILAIVIAALLLSGGCRTGNGGCGDNPQPIVSPTNTTDTHQGSDAPAFPYFIPWWAR